MPFPAPHAPWSPAVQGAALAVRNSRAPSFGVSASRQLTPPSKVSGKWFANPCYMRAFCNDCGLRFGCVRPAYVPSFRQGGQSLRRYLFFEVLRAQGHSFARTTPERLARSTSTIGRALRMESFCVLSAWRPFQPHATSSVGDEFLRALRGAVECQGVLDVLNTQPQSVIISYIEDDSSSPTVRPNDKTWSALYHIANRIARRQVRYPAVSPW